jgi:hypothetical protein
MDGPLRHGRVKPWVKPGHDVNRKGNDAEGQPTATAIRAKRRALMAAQAGCDWPNQGRLRPRGSKSGEMQPRLLGVSNQTLGSRQAIVSSGRIPACPVWFTGLMATDVPRRGTSDFNYPIKPYSFQKGGIVTDDEERAVESPQCFLQKFNGFKINVVGRFVENDQPSRR